MKRTLFFSENTIIIFFFLLASLTNYSQTIINQEKFNTDFGIWTAGGGNVIINNTLPYEGVSSVRIRGNTGMTLTSPTIGISTLAYDKIDFKFFLATNNNTTGETITLEYRNKTTDSWKPVRVITIRDDNVTNKTRDINSVNTYHAFFATLFKTDYEFSSTSQFRFISNLGKNDRYFFLDNISIIGTTYNTITKGPGGVTANLETWLKADKINGTGVATDNTVVNSWQDVGKGNDVNVIDAESAAFTNKPSYKNNLTNNVNFNPVVYFNNDPNSSSLDYTSLANKAELNATGGFYTQEQYIVVLNDIPSAFNSTTKSIDLFCAQTTANPFDSDGTGFGFGQYTVRFDNEVISFCIGSTANNGTTTASNLRGYGVNHNGTEINYSTLGILNSRNNTAITGQNLYLNANKINNQEVGVPQFLNHSNKRFWLGRSQIYNGSFGGRIAEVITYSARKNDATERRKIESYLAIKYGITLGTNGTTLNYQDSDGTVIWNATTNAGFNFDIAGIGKDLASELNQKQSKSVNPHTSTSYDDDITIGLTDIFATNSANTNTFASDKNFLVWGNNHNTLAAQPAVTVNISSGITTPSALTTNVSFISVGRTWKVVETGGNVPTAKVSIPSTMLTATITPPGDYLMFISSTPNFDPTAEYRVMKENGANLETTYDFNGTKYITFGYAPEQTYLRSVKFNGTTDYMDAGKVLDLNPSFTVSAWINKNDNNFNKTILSKRNTAFSTGYDLGINASGRAEMSWYSNGTKKTITSSAVIPIGKWHHIGVTFDGTIAKMYIDGINKISSDLAGIPSTTTESFLIAAANGTPPTSFFSGSIDEVRVWTSALSEAQFRFVMNQEIQQDTSKTRGAIIPTSISQNDIGIIDWTQLNAYYPMSTYTYTNAKDKSSYGLTAALKNLKTVDLQTAPLPYESAADGLWQTTETWTNSDLQDLPYSIAIEDPTKTIDWNIVKTTHNITSNGNKTVLGLFVNSNTLTATSASGLQTDGTKIEVSHYLKLDGKIDLVGRSQLVQKTGSDLDPTSFGSLERDQQGQSNKFNYNYWGSPVGGINATTNNNNFSVAEVLRNGTDPAAPGTITWINGFDGATSPFSLARYWIYKFDSNRHATDYANWTQIGETGILEAGKGFTLKGSSASTANQNLTFVGKPNNGTITNVVGSDQLLLVGNPYPSALDATKFINDNISSIETSTTDPVIDGTLYFWEHYTTNSSHNLGAYQGGYGIRNLAGGVAPSSVGVDYINTTGTSLREEPKRYIPVGQGFFVIGKIGSGGTVTFNNSQRDFVKEDSLGLSQIMYRIPTTPKDSNHWTDNSNAQIETDTHKRVRLGFNFYVQNFHRQVLLAFLDEKANTEMNDGYDAYNIDDSPSDMYLLHGENELAIQGEGYFDEKATYAIGVRSVATGKISFVLDGLENFDENQNVFIHDAQTATYNNIKDKAYEVELPKGTFNERFSLRFTDKSLATNELQYENTITVFFTRSNNVLNIKNNAIDNTVLSASLYNIQGKLISKWDVKEKEQSNIKIPIEDKISALYVVKIKTTKGHISKKIIIK
ncbi:LamG-like jellyroll fold domain-containing protein [Flavobacterium sp. W20_MBD1_R3]|uniref:LamG-like jellyroll fold domain-containing protein n=1 Tax=Flavobacterium sp. W20_MBD1_R3 TaxID=3240278 RepID=UPI003F8F5C51